MPNRKVLLNHEVTQVTWDGSVCTNAHPVRVMAKDTTTGHVKRYCAKRVISTVSLGVLEDELIDFKPKIDMALSPFKMGNLVKIYFRFPKKFWGDEEYITFLMDEDFRRNETAKTVKGEYFYNLEHWFKNSRDEKFVDNKSLFMFMAGPDLELIGVDDDAVDDAEFAKKVWHMLDPLREKYGEDYVEPNCWYFYNWDDVYHGGAYGIWKSGKTYWDYERFFEPRALDMDDSNSAEKVLYLSGEASCFNVWGYIEGAFESGSRDARLVLRDIRNDMDISAFSHCGMQREFIHCTTDCIY